MPKLVEYESPLADKGLTISDKGVNAVEQSAQFGISAARSEAADLRQSGQDLGGAVRSVGGVAAQAYQQFVVQPEISRAAKDASSLQFDLTNKWNTALRTADPNDAGVAQRFREQVLEPALEDFTSKYDTTADGRKFAESQANNFRAHMLDKQTVDMSNQAANALTVNLDKTANNLTNMVRADPTSFDHALQTFKGSVDALVGSSTFLSGDAANKIRTTITQKAASELAKAAILGTAERSPKDAQALLDSGKFNDLVDGNEMSSMIKTFTRMQRTDLLFNQAQEDRAKKQLSLDTRNDYEASIFTNHGDGVSLQKIWTDPKLLPQDREHLTSVMKGFMKPEAQARVDQVTRADLYRRIISDDPSEHMTSTQPISQAFADNKLTPNSYNFLMKEFTDSRSSDGQRFTPALSRFFSNMRESITKSNPLLGRADPTGNLQLDQYQNFVNQQLSEARKRGESPWDYITPGNPKYLGRPEVLQSFQKSLTESINDSAKRITGNAPGKNTNLTAPGNSIISITPGPVEDPTKPHAPNIGAPPRYPDAAQAPDGNWYVKRGNSYFRVKQ